MKTVRAAGAVLPVALTYGVCVPGPAPATVANAAGSAELSDSFRCEGEPQ